MCSLCAALGGSRYWTDAAGHDEFRHNGGKVTLRVEREKRVNFLNHILAISGLSISDWGGNSYVLEDGNGRRENVYNLAGIWDAVDEMVTTPCDPLDADFLEKMTVVAGSEKK